MRGRGLSAAALLAACSVAVMPVPLSAQGQPPSSGPALAIQAGWGLVIPAETEEIEWKVVYGAAFEYAFSRRFSLSLNLDHFSLENATGRFGFTRLVLQPALMTGRRANPKLFAGPRVGWVWKSSRLLPLFQDPATAHAVSVGLVAGTRSYLAPTVAVEWAVIADLMRFGDLVADGLSVHGTSSSATSLVFRAGIVLVLRGGQ